MAPPQPHTRSPVREGVLGFILGAVGGCALGVTHSPVNQAMAEIIEGSLLKPITAGVRTVGPLGLGTLLGATAVTAAMTAAVAGVIGAALVALLLVRLKSSGVEGVGGCVWFTAGLVAALSTTACGAAVGFAVEHLTHGWGVAALLWALVVFTALKMLVHVAVRLTCRERDRGNVLQLGARADGRGRSSLEAMEAEKRERVTVEIEHTIATLESSNGIERPKHRTAWETRWQEREEMETLKREMVEQKVIQQRLTKVMAKYVEFLAFSGAPMTVTAVVTASFGIFGYGDYRFVFVVLLALVLCMAFVLMRSMHLNFWMFTGCMAMFATFAIAVLTVHAGQEAAGMAVKMQQMGQKLNNEVITAQMDHRSSLEAIAASFFVSKVCQVGLGATVGGPLNPKVLVKVIVGGCVATVAIISIVEGSSVVLGVGGLTGALLGAVGASGVSLGAAAAVAVQWSSWVGTMSTTAGMFLGALAVGKWNIVNTAIYVLVAYIFAMINPY
ncbi:uncharacterized protein LOC143474342 [Brachyhypopomus gauderio]|uniref:uncharacterized protein LOC143474342 n=1 Tax=Brachyhypopomus gauderio TaxID=698409 RepID=UPI004041D34B